MSAAALFLLAFIAIGGPAPVLQDPSSPPPRVLNVTYTDGRTVGHISTDRGGRAWTPLFPKLAQWRSPEGLTVAAVDYKHRIEGTGIRVDVSLLLGTSHQRELKVASVLVQPDERVKVEALTDFGVAPVVLWIAELVPPSLHQPQVENRTAALQVEAIDVTADGPPGYRITVRNHAAKPVMTFHVETYRGSRRITSGRQGHRDGTPVVVPDDTYRFRITADQPRDLIAITGLMFEDGTVEGDADGVATSRLVYLGRRIQLERVLELFADAMQAPVTDPPATIATLASRIDVLGVLPDAAARQLGESLLPPGTSPGVVQAVGNSISVALAEVRSGARSDLQSAPRDHTGFERWLKEITAQYQAWHARFVALTARRAP